MHKRILLTLLFGVLFFVLPLGIALNIFAQTATSNCVITKVGDTGDTKPVLPPGCQTAGPDGVEPPPGLTCEPDGYCKMPDATDGSYKIYSCENLRFGSRELTSVLYTVAKRWKQKYPQGFMYIGDLNAVGHASHNIGIANDLSASTNGVDCVSNYDDYDKDPSCGTNNYNREATVELGKMLVDTNLVLNIWYSDPEVNNAVMEYTRASGKSPRLFNSPKNSPSVPGMRHQPGHANHFHLDVDIDPTLRFWEPSC